MSESRRASALAGLVVLGSVLAACGGPAATPSGVGSGAPSSAGGSPSASPSGSPASASPAASTTGGAVEHPTGATDVILRMETVGGFVPLELLAMRVPDWTLYGDGTLLLAPDEATLMNPVPGPTPPLRTVQLTPEQVQAVLDTALTRGGLAIARASYENNAVMDAPTTVFTVRAGGLDKEVRIAALDVDEPQPGPDTLARENFRELRVFLDGIAAEAADAAADFTPSGFTGVLLELEAGQPGHGPEQAWPWDDLVPSDFANAPAGAEFVALPEHALTVEQLEAVGITAPTGGHYGITLKADDGKRYKVIVRPQLPEETAAG